MRDNGGQNPEQLIKCTIKYEHKTRQKNNLNIYIIPLIK